MITGSKHAVARISGRLYSSNFIRQRIAIDTSQYHLQSGNNNTRLFSANITSLQGDEEKQQSNRGAFKATPIIPSILSYIEKIGVGMRPKRNKYNRRKLKRGANNNIIKGRRSNNGTNNTLDEIEESDYFAESEAQHRVQRRNKYDSANVQMKEGKCGRTDATKKSAPNIKKEDISENKGAYWLPPPPFSSSMRPGDVGTKEDSLHGRRIIRRPVKLLGKAGSLNDALPRDSKGLSEVAIAGRSNVGKSTLMNALLYGNTDESLLPRQYQRGRTPVGAKLPRGIKAITSSKPGQTKELSFYQLTADVVSEKNNSKEDETKELAKMSLLLVDLPGCVYISSSIGTDGHIIGSLESIIYYHIILCSTHISLFLSYVYPPRYGFAFAKEERTKEWKDLMHHYLLERRSLKRILLLLDARHGFKKQDFEFLGELQDGLMAKFDTNDDNGGGPKKVLTYGNCDIVGSHTLSFPCANFFCSHVLCSEGKERASPDTNRPYKMRSSQTS